MKNEIKLFLIIISVYVIIVVLNTPLGLSRYFSDLFIPFIPFFVLIKNTTLIIFLFFIMGLLSSVVYYDEVFSNILGYGISLILILTFSKKYSITNIFSYLISIGAISLIVFLVQMISYFWKDKIIVFSDLYQFLLMNLFIGFFYYILYTLLFASRGEEGVRR